MVSITFENKSNIAMHKAFLLWSGLVFLLDAAVSAVWQKCLYMHGFVLLKMVHAMVRTWMLLHFCAYSYVAVTLT